MCAGTWGLVRAGHHGWQHADVLGPLAAAAFALALGMVAARAAAEPVIPRGLLARPTVAAALIAGFVVGGVLAGELFLSTLELQQVRGLGPVLTGVAFVPLTLPMVLGPSLATRLIARVGPTRPVLAGLLLLVVATTILALAPVNGGSYLPLLVAFLLLGGGFALTLPALTSSIVLAAPPDGAATASGLFSVIRQMGATLWVAGSAAMIGGHSGPPASSHILFAVGGSVATCVWWAASRRARQRTCCARTTGRFTGRG